MEIFFVPGPSWKNYLYYFTSSRPLLSRKNKDFFSLSLQINGDNNGHDEAFTDVKLEVPASTPTGDPTVSPKVTMIVQKI